MRRTAVAALLVAVVGLWVVVPGAQPAGAAPGTPSAERLVSPVPVTGDQNSSDIAFDGTTFLVVWEDNRNGGDDIYGTRVDATGRVLDVGGIPISTSSGNQGAPAVTGTGTGFLVVWTDDRSGTADIYGARVAANGAVLDAAGIPISTATNFQSSADVAFDGTRAFVVWADARSIGSWDVYGARVSGSTVLDPTGVAVSTAAEFQWEPAVAFNGMTFMVVWEDGRAGSGNRAVFGARVSTDAVVFHTSGFQISGTSPLVASPAIAWSGQGYLVAWTVGGGARAAMLTPTGNIEVPDITLPAPSTARNPAVAYGGGTFLVVWSEDVDGSRAFGARVGLDGEVVDAERRDVGGAPGSVRGIAFGAGLHQVAIDSGTAFGQLDVVTARITPARLVLDAPARLVSLRPAFQNRAAIAYDGSNHLVAWADDRTGEANIFVARATPGGQLLDPRGVALTAVAGSDSFPSVAFDGTSHLVVWKNDPSGIDNASIRAQRVTKAGAPVGSAFVISDAANDQSEPDVVFDGTRFVVVWADMRNGGADIYAARVSPTGTVLDANGIPVSTATGSQSAPDVASDGTRSFVVWGDGRGASNDIYGARISTAGTVLEPGGFGVQTDGFFQFRPTVAFGGGRYLVAWDESGDIWGSRVTTAGAVLDPGGILVTTAPDTQDSPTIAFNGTFLVAWSDRRSGSTTDVYGTRVDGDGAVQDTSGLPLSTGLTNELSPALAPSGSGWSLVYDRGFGSGTAIHQRTVSSK